MFANLKFRDVFSFPCIPFAPQNRATGSYGCGLIPVACVQTTSAGNSGNYGDFRKWIAIISAGSGGATTQYNAWWGGASASGGTYSALPASSTSTFSGSQTYVASASGLYGSNGVLVMEIRGEYINNLNSGITWIQPIVSITGVSGYVTAIMFAFESGSAQASNFDALQAAVVLQETDAL